MDKKIEYRFFHWGPLLYKTYLTKEELDLIKDLCSKKNKNVNEELAGIIKHEHRLDRKKLFPILAPYFESYMQAFMQYNGGCLGNTIELLETWVNYMTKFETNPLHIHKEDLSFVLYTKVPKELKEEYNKNIGSTKPGAINFIYTFKTGDELINQHTFFPEIGELFIFPSSLHHYVNGFQCEGERVSISGNLKISNG